MGPRLGRGICTLLIQGLQPSLCLVRAVGELCPCPMPSGPSSDAGTYPLSAWAFLCPFHVPTLPLFGWKWDFWYLGLMEVRYCAAFGAGRWGQCWGGLGPISGQKISEGTELECLGLILGHPFLENLATSQGGKCVGHAPPASLGSKHGCRLGDDQTARPPTVIYTRTPSPSLAWSGSSIHP
jgi:hypothetical protein